MPEVSKQKLRTVLTSLQFAVDEGYSDSLNAETLAMIAEETFGEPYPSRHERDGENATTTIPRRKLARLIGCANAVDWSRGALAYECYPAVRKAAMEVAERHDIEGGIPDTVEVPAEELELVLERYWALSQETAGREPFAYEASAFLNDELVGQTE